MKFYAFLAFLSLIVAQTLAWGVGQRCVGEPVHQACDELVDHGHQRLRWCQKRAMKDMWYYHPKHHACLQMEYFGCGGTGNRYCTKQHCINKCLHFSRSFQAESGI